MNWLSIPLNSVAEGATYHSHLLDPTSVLRPWMQRNAGVNLILILVCEQPIDLLKCKLTAYSRGVMHCYAVDCDSMQSLAEEIVGIVERYGATCFVVTINGRLLDLVQALTPSLIDSGRPSNVNKAKLYVPNPTRFIACILKRGSVKRLRVRGNIVEVLIGNATIEDLIACGAIPTRMGSQNLSICFEHRGMYRRKEPGKG